MTNASPQRMERPQTPRPIQAKLTIGATDDPLEREADDIADRIMRMPSPSRPLLQRCPGGCPGDDELGASPTLQRCASGHPNEEIAWRHARLKGKEQQLQAKTDGDPSGSAKAPRISAVTERAIDRHRGAGAPLPPSTRRFFEPRFGTHFDNVRVHTDADAGRLADEVHARAFTVGHDVMFATGQFAPTTTAGLYLLAHELAHVVQQGPSRVCRRQTTTEGTQPISDDPDTSDQETLDFGPPIVLGAPAFPGGLTLDLPESATVSGLLDQLRLAWSWLATDITQATQVLDMMQTTLESARPLVQCAMRASGDHTLTQIGQLIALTTTITTTLAETANADHAAVQSYFTEALELLLELDDSFADLEQFDNVGSCGVVQVLPFLEGVAGEVEKLGSDEAQLLAERLAVNSLYTVIFPIPFVAGIGAGVWQHGKDALNSAIGVISDPAAAHKSVQAIVALAHELFGPTGAGVAKAIGASVGRQFTKDIIDLNRKHGPHDFAYALGLLVGPSILYTVLSLLGFEAAIAWRVVLLAKESLRNLKGLAKLRSILGHAPDPGVPGMGTRHDIGQDFDAPRQEPSETGETSNAPPSTAATVVREFAGGGRLTRGPDGKLRFCYNPCLDISDLGLTDDDLSEAYEKFHPFAEAMGEHGAWQDVWKMVFEDESRDEIETLKEIFRQLRGSDEEAKAASLFLINATKLYNADVKLPGGKNYLKSMYEDYEGQWLGQRLPVPTPETFVVEMRLRQLEKKMEQAVDNLLAGKKSSGPTATELADLEELIRVEAESRARAAGRQSDLSDHEIEQYREDMGYAHRLGSVRDVQARANDAKRVGGGGEHTVGGRGSTRGKHEQGRTRKLAQEQRALERLLERD